MTGERKVDRDNRGELSSRSGMDRDHVLAKLARRQQGVFTRWQLVSIGFTDDAIDRRLSSERLDIVHRGVLSIVPRQLMTRPAFFMAAVLVGGEVRC